MNMSLEGPSIAILLANGFDENHITAVQRSLSKAKKIAKLIAPEQGLVNGWQDNAWGHYFTVDEQIGTALGSDYDALILVGGQRGIEKLKGNLHTRRIVNHFLEAEKPVAAIGEGVALLALSPKSAGLTVSAPATATADLTAAQMELSSEAQMQDGSVLTSNGAAIEAWVDALMQQIDAIVPESCEEAA